MNEIILEAKALPEPLFKLIRTSKVKVCEADGIINLIPIKENIENCPIRGIAADCGFTVEDFLAKKHEEKVLEGE